VSTHEIGRSLTLLRYNPQEMSPLFESFNFLDRGWDVRTLENQSLRSVFLWLVLLLFLIGALTAQAMHQLLRLHHFDWLSVIVLANLGLFAFRSVRLIYRRLGR
jgi:hypothetical protein